MTQLQTPERRDIAHQAADGSSRARLTSNRIEGLEPRSKLYEITDRSCAGLKLRIRPSGTKVWAYRFYWEGRRQLLQLGTWPGTSLATARERAIAARAVLREGIDPRNAGLVSTKPKHNGRVSPSAIRPEPTVTRSLRTDAPRREVRATDLSDDAHDLPPDPHSVKFLAHEFYYRHIVSERGYVLPEFVKDILNRDVLPYWADRDARTIQPREVIDRLDQIVDRGSKVMANRVADNIRLMFNYGIHRRIVADSPVKLLYKPGGTENTRERSFDHDELKAFLLNYKQACRTRRIAHILLVLLLTLQRRQELALARKSDFDLDAGTWSVPDDLAKGKRGQRRGHVLPLTPWVVTEVRALMDLAGESQYLLPREGGEQPINPKVITRAVKRLQRRFEKFGIKPWTPHDLRRTGRTALSALGVEDKIAERVINHKPARIKRVYDRYEYFKEKKDALTRWEQHLSNIIEQATKANDSRSNKSRELQAFVPK
jgi:integrase